MAMPKLTDEERLEALEKAKAARKKRADFLNEVRSSKLTPMKAIDEAKDDEVLGRIRVASLIEAVPGWGKAKTANIMHEFGIAENRRIRGLGKRQIAKLAEVFD